MAASGGIECCDLQTHVILPSVGRFLLTFNHAVPPCRSPATPLSLPLHRRLYGLFHVGVDFGGGGVGLAVHPLVEAAALEAPAVPEFEGGDEALRGVFVEGVGRDSEVVGGLADVHDFADFGDKKVGAESGIAHDGYPRQDSGGAV